MSEAGAQLPVVDDAADMLRLLTMRLTAAGYRVSAVTSAEAAMTQLHIERPQLVLSDVRLPGRDGLALFDDIQARHPSLFGQYFPHGGGRPVADANFEHVAGVCSTGGLCQCCCGRYAPDHVNPYPNLHRESNDNTRHKQRQRQHGRCWRARRLQPAKRWFSSQGES